MPGYESRAQGGPESKAGLTLDAAEDSIIPVTMFIPSPKCSLTLFLTT